MFLFVTFALAMSALGAAADAEKRIKDLQKRVDELQAPTARRAEELC